MVSIFSNLYTELIHYILTYDRHFIIKRGKLLSIIPKDDERYKLLLAKPVVSKCVFDTIGKNYQINIGDKGKIIYKYYEDINNIIFIKNCEYIQDIHTIHTIHNIITLPVTNV